MEMHRIVTTDVSMRRNRLCNLLSDDSFGRHIAVTTKLVLVPSREFITFGLCSHVVLNSDLVKNFFSKIVNLKNHPTKGAGLRFMMPLRNLVLSNQY